MGEIEEKKIQFAEALRLEPSEPMKAGMLCFPLDFPKAAQAASQWPNDPFVKAELKRLTEEAEEEKLSALPDKLKHALSVWSMANDVTIEPKERLIAHKLYAEMMEHIPKPQAANVNVNVDNRRVMLINETPSLDAWEQKAIIQQENITNASTSH
jgi:hypothetical protein